MANSPKGLRWLAISLIRLFFPIACTATLSGCGILGLCGNSCDPGWCHASFDCGCAQCTPMKAGTSAPGNPYYVTRRYSCRDRSNPSINPECDITDSSTNSCEDALRASQTHGDPCPSLCNSGVYDADRYSDGSSYIQGGPCQGYASNTPTLIHHAQLQTGWSLDGHGNRQYLNYTPIPTTRYGELLASIAANEEPPKDNSFATCQSLCASPSRFCLRLAVGSAAKEGLRRLQRSAAGNPSVIKAADLQTMFGVTDDPCNRGDTTIERANLLNSGNSMCNLRTQIPGSEVTIQIPEILRGDWISNSVLVQLIFDDQRTRPRLSFSNDMLEHAWGGEVVIVASEGNYLYFSVGRTKCIRANLQ
jgi:hypothetical protein